METKAIHGLAEPDEYKFPDPHALWNQNTYNSFNISKAVEMKDKGSVSFILQKNIRK